MRRSKFYLSEKIEVLSQREDRSLPQREDRSLSQREDHAETMSTTELKQARSTAKAGVTKAKTEIEGALYRGEQDISSLIDKLKDKLDNFKQSHEDYVKLITDDEDIERETSYYDEVITSAQELLDKTEQGQDEPSADAIKKLKAKKKLLKKKFALEEEERWLQQKKEMYELEKELIDLDGDISDSDDEEAIKPEQKSPSEAGSSNSIILQSQKQLIDLLAAPKLEIPTFDGSPILYFPFIKAFEENVERVVSDHSSRLTRLLQYCTGPAKQLIQCCAMMPSSQGYTRARALLKERFGNEFLVCTTFIERATHGGAIMGNTGLRSYSDELRNGYEMLNAMNCLGEMNIQSNLMKIVSRLPNYVQNCWRHEVSRIKREQMRLPSFYDVVRLVEEAADEANDPVFGTSLKASTNEVKQTAK